MLRWHTSLTPALGKQQQADFCKFKASLVKEFQDSHGYTVRPCLTTPMRKLNKCINEQEKGRAGRREDGGEL